MSVKRSNLTLVNFKTAYRANRGAERNFAGSSHIFQDRYF